MRQPIRKKFLHMSIARSFILSLLVFVTFTCTFGQFEKVSAPSLSTSIFPVSEIREGMHGTARTVFRGSVPEEFSVEILGVMPNWIGPKQDLIVGKLSGANAERTFVFAGMSGSPVYIDGRLVGAISYSFPFAKEPICGITPFEQMVSAVEKVPAPAMASSGPRTFSYAEFLSNNSPPQLSRQTTLNGPLATGFSHDSRLMAIAGQTFKPISTPVTFAGLSQQTLDRFADQFLAAGILPVAASAGSSGNSELKAATSETLLGGDSVVVHLARGDILIAAAGTVTLRDGNKIYAFGHPFFGLGTTDLPMSESHVVTVVPNANNSFKLAVPDSTVGAMTQDRATGIYGMLGQAPRMLPVKIKIVTSRGRSEEINFESAIDEVLTPLIINAGVGNVLSANERGFGDSTIQVTCEIKINGEQSITFDRRFAGPQAALFAASSAAVPLSALLRADFEGTTISGVTLNISAVDGSKSAVLDQVSVDKDEVRAGETVELIAYERTAAGKIIIQKIPVLIPSDTAAGPITITLGDGNAVQQNSAITQFVAKSAAELISTVNHLKRPDRLYAVVSRISNGAVIGSSEMPNLPPSMLATLNNERTAGSLKPAVQTVLTTADVPPGEYMVTGHQSLKIEVVR
jgi:SpoIVB peptidase S55